MTDGLNYKLIKKATSGDEIAIAKILAIYEPYINTLVSEPVYDRDGNEYVGVNVDLQYHLISKVLQIIQNFEVA